MNFPEIAKKYPLSYEKLIERLTTLQPNPEVAQAAIKLALAHMTARSLFDFFDENNLYINTIYMPIGGVWRVVVDKPNSRDDGPIYVSEVRSTRKDAEEDGVLVAFQLLENGLTSR